MTGYLPEALQDELRLARRQTRRDESTRVVHVGDEALVGVGARVIPGRRIGGRAVVGAGAVVIEDVPDGSTVVGTASTIR